MKIRMLAGTCAALMLSGAMLLHAAQDTPPKGYVVGEVQIHDPEGYRAYAEATTALLERFGGRYLARAGRTVTLQGNPPAGRVVVIEFPSVAAAQAFHDSPEYRAVAAIRHRTSTGRSFVIEGIAP